MEEDEDFSWEDDEDEPTTAKPSGHTQESAQSLRASIDTLQPPPASGRTSSEHSSPGTSEAEASRRQSSEDSYDVVSSQVSTSGDLPQTKKQPRDGEEEEEDDDDDDEDDGEEEDSDWE